MGDKREEALTNWTYKSRNINWIADFPHLRKFHNKEKEAICHYSRELSGRTVSLISLFK